MEILLGLVLLSFFITSLFMVPFIDMLYILRSKYKRSFPKGYNDHNTPIHNKLLAGKDVDTPVGGGILLVLLIPILSIILAFYFEGQINLELLILIFSFLSFGAIGLLDDGKKIFIAFSGKYKGLRGRYIFILQTIFALIISFWLYNGLGFNNIYVSGIGNLIINFWYIPMATFVIVAFSNALNISDGLDGLSSGLLLICLFALLAMASANLDLTLSRFIGLWIGALFAYLYFNIYPARIYLGDAGAFAFGATLAVVGLLSGKIIALGIIGGVYVIIVGSSALQILSKRFLHRKILPVTPIHMYFRYVGWEEPKVVIRFWLAAGIFAILGLWLALLSR
jgi:phospho-N-acetylmuramoyl-pentapeptide-transferase